jgi:hypothetical protein
VPAGSLSELVGVVDGYFVEWAAIVSSSVPFSLWNHLEIILLVFSLESSLLNLLSGLGLGLGLGPVLLGAGLQERKRREL